MEQAPSKSFFQSAKAIVITGPINLLLFATPVGIAAWSLDWYPIVTFVFSLAALAPLAERLGYVTEQISFHTNDTIGGLLNATFGNATELLVALVALRKGQYRLVQLSLLGSILSNLLLVLGMAFLFGGLRHKIQTYGTISSQMNSTLLMLSVMGLLFPTVLTLSGEESRLGELGLSRGTSLLLFFLYFAFIYFQLKTHRHLYEGDSSIMDNKSVLDAEMKQNTDTTTSPIIHSKSSSTTDIEALHMITEHDEHSAHGHDAIGSVIPLINTTILKNNNSTPAYSKLPITDTSPTKSTPVDNNDEDNEEEQDELGFYNAIFWLMVMTVIIAILSEAISASIEMAGQQAKISPVFLSAIILPIVGNAAEHAGAVMFAMKNKVDLALAVAIGSSTQIGLCVLPFVVLIGWIMNKDMDLNFGAYESVCLLLTVVSVTFAIKDGKSNWLLGAALNVGYLIIAIGFWSHTTESLE